LSFAFVGVKSVEAETGTGTIKVWQEREIEGEDLKFNVLGGSCVLPDDSIFVSVSNLTKYGLPIDDNNIVIILKWGPTKAIQETSKTVKVKNGQSEIAKFNENFSENDRVFEVQVRSSSDLGIFEKFTFNFNIVTTDKTTRISDSCDPSVCNTDLETNFYPYEVCNQIDDESPEYQRCFECFAEKEGVWTAVGCIPQDPASAIESLVKIGLGIAGGVVLIMIIVGAFMLSASQGDPNKVGEAKEIITSAIIGLIFIIFSVTLLQFIGVEILHIPGFGE